MVRGPHRHSADALVSATGASVTLVVAAAMLVEAAEDERPGIGNRKGSSGRSNCTLDIRHNNPCQKHPVLLAITQKLGLAGTPGTPAKFSQLWWCTPRMLVAELPL